MSTGGRSARAAGAGLAALGLCICGACGSGSAGARDGGPQGRADAPDAGVPPDAGEDGSTSSPDAGTDAPGDAGGPWPLLPPLIDGALAFCLAVDGCGYGLPLDLASLSACVTDVVGQRAPGLGTWTTDYAAGSDFFAYWSDCMLGAGSCADVAVCLGGGAPPEPCSLDAKTLPLPPNCCDGTVHRLCWEFGDSGWMVGWDCWRTMGWICVEYVDWDTADCAIGECSTIGPYECVGDTDVVAGCNGFAEVEFDCQILGGLECVDGSCIGVDCDPATDSPYCAGSESNICTGEWYVMDCSGRADATACVGGYCVPSGEECDNESYPSECDGASISYCLDGYVGWFDCTSLFFTACDPGPPARCVP